MVGGLLSNVKIGAIIQARMESTRLPGKVLLPVPLNGGKPLLKWITDELDKSKFIDKKIIATSTNKENDQLEIFTEKLGNTDLFRGKEEDVLSRFFEINTSNNFDAIVRLTGDNPFIDIELLDKTIHYHIKKQNDYTNTTDLPVGMNFEIVSSDALDSLKAKKLTNKDKEHVTLAMKNDDSYQKSVLKIDVPEYLKNIRLTVDYPSDFALASILFSIIKKDKSPNISFLEGVYDRFPWLFGINDTNLQKKQFEKTKDEIDFAKGILEDLELENALQILRYYSE